MCMEAPESIVHLWEAFALCSGSLVSDVATNVVSADRDFLCDLEILFPFRSVPEDPLFNALLLCPIPALP